MSSPMVAPLKARVSDAGAADDGVAAVARVPGDRVGAGAAFDQVGAGVAVDRVVVQPADQLLRADATQEGVIAGIAVQGRCLLGGEAAEGLVDPDGVVATAGLDVDLGEAIALESELGGAVTAAVDLERRRVARGESQDDDVGRCRAGHDQGRALDLGLDGSRLRRGPERLRMRGR